MSMNLVGSSISWTTSNLVTPTSLREFAAFMRDASRKVSSAPGITCTWTNVTNASAAIGFSFERAVATDGTRGEDPSDDSPQLVLREERLQQYGVDGGRHAVPFAELDDDPRELIDLRAPVRERVLRHRGVVLRPQRGEDVEEARDVLVIEVHARRLGDRDDLPLRRDHQVAGRTGRLLEAPYALVQ